MRALWLQNRTVSLRDDLSRPVRAPGEVLVRVTLAGICGTDLALLHGHYGFTGVPGHEFVGVVAAADDAALLGQRVVGEINVGCGHCQTCRNDRREHCDERTVLGIRGRPGAFAEYLTLPVANLLAVPAGVGDERAVFTEPLAAALEIEAQLPIRRLDRVLLIGAGRLGQLIALTLLLTGCELSVVARHPRQRALLVERGIPVVGETEVPERRFDRVIEASGSVTGFALARRAVRPGGSIILKSTYREAVPVDLAGLVVDEVTLVGSRCGRFAPALRLLECGAIDPTRLIDAEYPLEQGAEAFAHCARPGTLKILLRP